MAELKREYTDVKGRTHKVEHIVVSGGEQADRERVMEELIAILAKPDGGVSP
ncbi:hypothetical protein [uncultured Oscillibacter sp.]|uniref:hypothetical protein n=1 Tax=uncultured Oscillibacter sp. TaxID=876091 RepID=UPI002613CF11|nr:hypothetical protein [uncultured Oscillibacter sp.]